MEKEHVSSVFETIVKGWGHGEQGDLVWVRDNADWSSIHREVLQNPLPIESNVDMSSHQ
jgi:hypothetical protein